MGDMEKLVDGVLLGVGVGLEVRLCDGDRPWLPETVAELLRDCVGEMDALGVPEPLCVSDSLRVAMGVGVPDSVAVWVAVSDFVGVMVREKDAERLGETDDVADCDADIVPEIESDADALGAQVSLRPLMSWP